MFAIIDDHVVSAATNLLESAAVAVIAVLFSFMINERLGRRRFLGSIFIGVAFALMGIAGMAEPVELTPGIMFDARNVDIAMSAYLGGPISAAITAAGVSAVRMMKGGAGAVPGSTAMWMAAVFCSLIWIYVRVDPKVRLRYRMIVLGAVLTALSPPVATYLIGLDWKIIANILTYHVPTDLAGVCLLGYLYLREQRRRWAAAEHAESQARLDTVAAHAPGVLFQVMRTSRGSHRLTYLSSGSERILGWPAKMLVDNPRSLNRIIRPETLEEFGRFLDAAKTGEKRSFDIELTRPDGGTVWMRAGVAPRTNEDGVMVWEGTLFDLTEERRNESLRNDFVATVSHELRTPLTSIRGSLALAGAGAAGVLPEKAAQLVRIAHSNSERLIRLVNDILDIEKIESGHMPLHMARLPIRAIVEEAVISNASYADQCRIGLRVVDEAPNATVLVDRDRLHQVIDNLLSNAVKFSEPGTKVEIRIERRGDEVRLSVIDDGPGIPTDFLGRIFRKFEQVDSTDRRAKGGSGLGLSIVKGIVERLGGQVGVESTIGAGSTFTVDLPGEFPRPIQSDITGEMLPRERMNPPRPGVLKLRMLHVDADESLRAMVAAALSDDVEVVSVGSFAAARSRLIEETYDLVLMDPALPDACGAPLSKIVGQDTALLVFAADERARDKIERADLCAIVKTRASETEVVGLIRTMLTAGNLRQTA